MRIDGNRIGFFSLVVEENGQKDHDKDWESNAKKEYCFKIESFSNPLLVFGCVTVLSEKVSVLNVLTV
jgi:hypothetical protein